MSNSELARSTLQSGGYTCVLACGERLVTSTQRGVKPLVLFLECGENFAGFSAADRVVGKATAFLYVLLGVQAVYAQVISRAALQVLTDFGIAVTYDSLAEHIINRQGTGICPFEAAVLPIQTPSEAYSAIRKKMQELGITV